MTLSLQIRHQPQHKNLGNFQVHLPYCLLKSCWKVTQVFIRGVSQQGKAIKLQENMSSTRDLQQHCVNILQVKSCVAHSIPNKQTNRMTFSLPRWTVHHSALLQLFPSAARLLFSSQLFSLLEQLSLSLAHKVWTKRGEKKKGTFIVRIIPWV